MTDSRYDLDEALVAADKAFRNLTSIIGPSVNRSARQFDLEKAMDALETALRTAKEARSAEVMSSPQATTEPQVTADLGAASVHLAETARLLDAAQAAHGRATSALADARNTDLKPPFDTSFTPPPHTGEHRREHRSGVPRKIDTDPELRAFIEARVDHMTFPQLAAAVAETFPPGRRVGKSAIHAWWTRQPRRSP